MFVYRRVLVWLLWDGFHFFKGNIEIMLGSHTPFFPGHSFFFQVLFQTDIILHAFVHGWITTPMPTWPAPGSIGRTTEKWRFHHDIWCKKINYVFVHWSLFVSRKMPLKIHILNIFTAINRNFCENPPSSIGFMEMWYPIVSNVVLVFSITIFALKQNFKDTAFSNRLLWKEVSILKSWSKGEELKLAKRGERFGTGKGTPPLHRTAIQMDGIDSSVSSLERIFGWFFCDAQSRRERNRVAGVYFLHCFYWRTHFDKLFLAPPKQSDLYGL